MKPDDIVVAVYNDLVQWKLGLTGYTADVALCRDPFQTFHAFSTGPSGLLVAVQWGGDRNISDEPGEAITALSVEITVGFPLSPTALKDADLYKNVTGKRPSLLRTVDIVRARIMSLCFQSNDVDDWDRFKYDDCAVYEVGGMPPFAAYQLRFTIHTKAAGDANDRPATP